MRRSIGGGLSKETLMRRFLQRLSDRARMLVSWARLKRFSFASNEERIRFLRSQGVRIGEDCWVFTPHFSESPYLVELGNRVAISTGTVFITHDGSGWVFEDHPKMDVFGTIQVRDNVYIGLNCTILPNTVIGSNCIIGTGSVVRGVIPDGSVVFGNPARVVMKTALAKQLLVNSKNRLDTRNWPPAEKHRAVRQHFGR
jgi:acetyltransferase-like isoleucine patch superfamily enzyme